MRYRDIILARALGKGKRGMAVGWPLMLGIAGGGGGTETTVTGVSPLFLEAAIKAKIKSLTQYGKVTQADTPSGSNVPIVCNNGTLTMVDDELPRGYKRLTGISFDGDTWYETGEALTGADEVTMTLGNTASQGQNVFGSYNGTSSGTKNFSLFIYGNGSSTSSYFRYGEQLLRPRFGTGERTITFGKNGTDGFASDATATPDTFTTPANAYIGMLPNSTSPAYTGDIKGNITVGTRLKWIPCERVSDNAIGYYEAVNGAFVAPSGTGTPTALGYDGSHYSLAVVGTDEAISVGGKNLNGGEIGHKGYSTSTGQESTAAYLAGTYWKIPNVTGKTLTISWGGFPDGVTGVSVTAWKANGAWIATQNIQTTSPYTITIQPSAPTSTVNFAVYKTGGITIGEDAWIQVEYGDTATEHQPYIAPQTASAPDLFAVGDYADEVEIISGGVKRKVGIKVFDGTESFTKSGALYIYSAADKAATKSPVLCSHFSYFNGTTSDAADGNLITHTNTNLYFKNSTTATLEAWRAFLSAEYAAGHPVIVIYPLATETTESVTPQALHTNAGDNTVSWTAAVEGKTMDVTYMKESA